MNGPPQPEDEYEGPDHVAGMLVLILASGSFLVAMAPGGAGRLPPDMVLELIGVLAVCGTVLKIVKVLAS